MKLNKILRLQENLCNNLILKPPTTIFNNIGGCDVSFVNDEGFGVICIFSLPELKIIEEVSVIQKVKYPYIPGVFILREGKIIMDLIKKLRIYPDVLLIDAHGIAHPRGFGLASHIGYLTKIPTIGCAKTKLVGEYEEPEEKRGSCTPLIYNNKIVGAVVRTSPKTRPLFVSPGNLIDIETSIKVVLSCCNGYRLPEPLRIANIKSKKLRNHLFQKV